MHPAPEGNHEGEHTARKTTKRKQKAERNRRKVRTFPNKGKGKVEYNRFVEKDNGRNEGLLYEGKTVFLSTHPQNNLA